MLKDLRFTDLYLGSKVSHLTGAEGDDFCPVPDTCGADIEALRALCKAEKVRSEFTVRHDGVSYRVSLMVSLDQEVYVLRKFPERVPVLEEQGIHPAYVAQLKESGLGGLVIIAGAYGQGKTTTASSVVAARLNEFGGVCITVEDPPEMPLEGKHGKGVCYQTWANQGGFGQACRNVARYAPTVIFLGEVRDAETASEALRASINGRLVICTLHADSVTSAIERIFALANGEAGQSEDVASLLAQGLSIVIHQKLEQDPANPAARRPKIEFLSLLGDEATGARNTIRTRKFVQIENEIQMQLNRMRLNRGR